MRVEAAVTSSANHGAGSGGALPPGPMGIGSGWQFVGFSESHARPEWCWRPLKFVNARTGEHFVRRCGSSRSSRCEPCAELKRGDIAAVGRSGWMGDRPGATGYFVTLTAPGASVLPWDQSQCTHSAGVACAGDLGCVVDQWALAAWHNGLGLRWSHWVTDLRRVLARRYPGVQVEFFKGWEPQKRGPLHAHSMIRVTGAPVTTRAMRAAVRLVTTRNGFGPQWKCDPVDLSDSRSAARCAGYCAKYASKSADALPTVQRLDVATGEVRCGGVRAWSASRRWGLTMRAINARRVAFAAGGAQAGGGDPAAGDAVGGALDLKTESYARGVMDGPSVVGSLAM